MSKVIAFSVIAVLLVSSNAMATVGIDNGILHFQDLGTTMLNGVNLMHGEQQADSSNWATVQNGQQSAGDCGLFAGEDQTAFFSQVGSATGCCALVDLDQTVLGAAAQQQTIGAGVGPKLQTENLTLSGTQLVSKADGGGNVVGDQIMSLAQNQTNSNPMNQSSVVFGAQNTTVSGAPGATGAAGSSLLVTTTQEQMVY